MHQKVLKAAFVLGFAGMASLAHADGWYVGAGIGQSTFKDWNNQPQIAGFASSTNTDTSYNLFAGYAFNPYISAEGSYVDLGKFTADAGGMHDEFKASGLTAAAVGTLPIDDTFGLFAKAGLFRWDTKNSGAASGSAESTGISPLFGVGASINATQNLGFRLGYDIFKDVGDQNNTGKGDIDVASVGVVFNFK